MRKIFLPALLSLLYLASAAQTKTYKGAWFSIKYPSGFTVKPSIKSASVDNRYESAYFVSPDQHVEFYVFSPQWDGNPTDIALQKSEKLISSNKTTKGTQDQKFWTIKANDGSYTRSYSQVSDETLHTIRVIGIKYKDQEAYNKYKSQYLAFKASLAQYAD